MKDQDRNSNPDALLRAIERDETKAKRGRLRIFLGMCPGVGKTYAMLQAAQEKANGGTDVLVGIVETHNRKETVALLEGLKQLPRKRIEYRGKPFEELDVDAVLEKRPALVLVDELAHSNIPGSRHPKRYHDIKEILEAGIDVFTTMNVQHLESRIDLVRQITGVPVSETVPDSFFELANQVELIDLSPVELIKRLKEGKVYLGEMAERAVEGFFQEEHLMALRELALRFTAEIVEGELHDQMLKKQIAGPWQTRERILVAISHSPYSKRLIRATRRMAFNLEAQWIALYVDNGEALSEQDKAMLRKNMDMARELGAELVSIRDTDIPSAIRKVAEEKNVTQILMGRPDRRFFRDVLSGGTILDKLVRETSEIDIHVLRQVRKPRLKALGFKFRMPAELDDLSVYSNTFWAIAATGAIGAVLEPIIKYQAVGFLFLMAVIGVGALAPRGPAIFAALLSAFVWNFCFIPPKFTLFIAEVADIMMCIAYLAVAVTASILTSKIRKQAEELKIRSRRTGLLYDFSRELSSSPDTKSIVDVTCRFIERTIGGASLILVPDENGKLKDAGHSPHAFRNPTEKDYAVAAWVKDNAKKAGFGTETLSGSEVLCLPIRGSHEAVAVLMFFPRDKKSLSIEEEGTLESACASFAICVEREKLKAKNETLRIVEESEKLYQTILDSVSHEIRTPITAIMGAASALQDGETVRNEKNRKSLTEDIFSGAKRLNHVVENLLDTSRMSTGRLVLKKELVELSETVESIVREWKSTDQIANPIHIDATDTIYAEVDNRLLRHALSNLLRNAVTYSPPGGEIKVAVTADAPKKQATIAVVDQGKGISDSDRAGLFQRFYRVPGTAAGGIGLGLSIVKGVVEAHGGFVQAVNRADRRGSQFNMVIPVWTEKVPEA